MKFILTFFATVLFGVTSFAQNFDKSINTIDVQGFAKLLVTPENYLAQFSVQEEEQKIGYTTIGKLPIDSVKINLFSNLKRFGINANDIKITGTSSHEIGQYPNFLINISYEVKLKDKETANKLVNEMRFAGLKGIVIKRVFTTTQKNVLADSLYNEAILDARRIANGLSKKSNKMIGEIKSIEIRANPITLFGMDTEANYDNYNPYGMNKFEMDYRDKYATCLVRVIFEMK